MFPRIAGLAIMSLAVAACGGKDEPKKERALTPPPINESPAPLPNLLPLASSADITMSWSLQDLATALQSGKLVSAVPSEDGVILKRSSDGEDVSGGRTSGAFIAIPGSNTLDYSGLSIGISVTVVSLSGGDTSFRVAYSTARKGNSGWRDFTIGVEPTVVSFTYKIPEGFDETTDFIGLSVENGADVLVTEVTISAEDRK